MQLFKCQNCSQLLFFENKHCERCNHRLGYIAPEFRLSALRPHDNDGTWTEAATPGPAYRFCDNARHGVCNWLVPAHSTNRYCIACRHNRMVPDLSAPENRDAWDKIEIAKHRLFYQLMRLDLPIPNKADNPERGLMFDFLKDPATPGSKVLTGHDNGLITLALSEADDAERERRRATMREPYRALIGHFRHEVGHYYWDRLVKDEHRLDACRAVFGDDREDYEQALKTHYRNGPPDGWREQYVSAYATTHAWEDWAETWAHYLHIVDSLDTAGAFGLEVHPSLTKDPALHAQMQVDSYAPGDFTRLVDAWLPLTFAMNSMNRSMGLPDLYPFVLTGPVIRKLGFIHDLVHSPHDAIETVA